VELRGDIMFILGTIKGIKQGYDNNTIEVFIIDQLGHSYANIVPRINVSKNDKVVCKLYANLYSVQVESIKKV